MVLFQFILAFFVETIKVYLLGEDGFKWYRIGADAELD